MADLPLVLERVQLAERLGDRHVRVGGVQLVQVDSLEPKPLQAALARLAQVVRMPVAVPLGRARSAQPALRRDDEVVRVGVERLRDQLFADMRPVRVGRVDQVHAQLDRPPQHAQRVLAVGRVAPDPVADDPHRAEAEPVHGHVGDVEGARRARVSHGLERTRGVRLEPCRIRVRPTSSSSVPGWPDSPRRASWLPTGSTASSSRRATASAAGRSTIRSATGRSSRSAGSGSGRPRRACSS